MRLRNERLLIMERMQATQQRDQQETAEAQEQSEERGGEAAASSSSHSEGQHEFSMPIRPPPYEAAILQPRDFSPPQIEEAPFPKGGTGEEEAAALPNQGGKVAVLARDRVTGTVLSVGTLPTENEEEEEESEVEEEEDPQPSKVVVLARDEISGAVVSVGTAPVL